MSRCIDNLKENLLHIMEVKDYTVFEMSVQCDISMRELQKIIGRNCKGIHLSTLERISKSLEMPISDLIEQKGGAA